MSKKRIREGLSGASAAARICARMALPEEGDPIRYADQYTAEKTAVANPFREDKINWSTVPAAGAQQLAATDMMLFLFRDALRHTIRYDPNSAGALCDITWMFSSGSAIVSTSELGVAIQTKVLQPVWGAATSVYRPHGDYLYCGRDEECDESDMGFMYIDSTTLYPGLLTLNFTGDPGTRTNAIEIFRWIDGEAVRVMTQNTTAGTTLYSLISLPTVSGYYGLKVAVAATATALAVSHRCQSSIWCHQPVRNIALNQNDITGIRILGAGMRWTNEAAPLNKQGNIVACASGPGETWQTFAAGGYNFIASYPDMRSRLLASGLYTFLKPQQEQDFSMQQPFILGPLGVNEAHFTLRHRSGFVVAAASCVLPAGCDTILHVSSFVEYRTRNLWTPIEKTPYTTEDWIAALEIFKSLEQFYDNPVHIRDIIGTIGRYARVGAKYLAMIPHPYARAGAAVLGGVGLGASLLE